MDKPVIIFGAKGIAKSVLEIFESNHIVIYGFLEEDEKLHHSEINSVPVLGSPDDDSFLNLIGKECEAFVAFDENTLRKDQTDLLRNERQTMPINAIHPSANIAESSSIGHGNYIGAKSVIGAFSTIGHHGIFNTGALIDYDVKIGDFVQIGAGSIINPGVEIGEQAFIGTGATLISGIKIGANARVGAGSIVVKNVGEDETVFGNPAQTV